MKTRNILLLAAGLILPFAGWAADVSNSDYTPMKIIQTDNAVFPLAARNVGILEGEARITISVDETGKLADYLVTGYTYPAFGESAVSTVKRWRYEPAILRGQPHSTAIDLTFTFESQGLTVVSLDTNTFVEQFHYLQHPGAFGYKVCTLAELDRIPTPSKVVRPMYALETAKHQDGVVVVSVIFFIDEQGHVRMPSISRQTGETNELLAGSAVAAVSQWEFEPPLSHGHPVLVEARQDFNFKPTPSKP